MTEPQQLQSQQQERRRPPQQSVRSADIDLFELANRVFDASTNGEGKNYVALAHDARRSRDKLISNLMNHVLLLSPLVLSLCDCDIHLHLHHIYS